MIGGGELDRAAMDLVGKMLELSPEQRESRLAELARQDQALHDRVAELLREQTAQIPSHSAPSNVAELTPSWFVEPGRDATIQQIGQYRLLGRIGAGGMGEVYEAEQQRPHRHVALKLIHPQRMSRSLLRRFEFEAEILARLDHPGIARVLDAGTAQTPFGPQPYFAMELVRGRRLDQWVVSRKPDLHARIQILLDICDAVQHAHQRGVIHRDLKPANILLDGKGKPKILDFGVARAMEDDSAAPAETQHTETGQLLGTLQYMSPEQASGDVRNLDTRSDVYALGVIAYQLLCDRLPYDVSDKPLPEALRIICQDEPSRMGTINRSLRGDLETIVLKAIAKEKENRYASTAELTADVKRYLNYEPITARPPSAWYQFSKFARRNKLAVGSACALFIVLLGGTIGTTIGLVSANRARLAEAKLRKEAQGASATAQATSDFLAEMLESVSPDRSLGKPVLVRDVLDRAAPQLDQKFADQPEVRASLHAAIGRTYYALGLLPEARRHSAEALAITRQLYGETFPQTLKAKEAFATLLTGTGEAAEAERLAREVWQQRQERFGNDDPRTLDAQECVALALFSIPSYQRAESLLRDLLERQNRVRGPDDPATINTLEGLSSVLDLLGKPREAEPMIRDVVERRRRSLGPDHPMTLVAENNLAALLCSLERYDESEQLHRDVLARRRRVLGEDHPDTLGSLHQLAGTLLDADRLAEAEKLYREVLERRRRVLGEAHRDTLIAQSNLATTLGRLDRNDQAEAVLRDALGRLRDSLGPSHPHTLAVLFNLTECLRRQKRYEETVPLLEELVAQSRQADVRRSEFGQYLASYGFMLFRGDRYSDAEPVLREAEEVLGSADALDGRHGRAVASSMETICRANGRADEADAWHAKYLARGGKPAAAPTTATMPASAK